MTRWKAPKKCSRRYEAARVLRKDGRAVDQVHDEQREIVARSALRDLAHFDGMREGGLDWRRGRCVRSRRDSRVRQGSKRLLSKRSLPMRLQGRP